jgi:RHS repeat-associated protein
LGNSRVTFRDVDDGLVAANAITQLNHYYPFGLNMEGNWNGASGENKYQYNGKEWNDDFGLGLNDYGRRMYDPALGRFGVIDRFSEKYLSLNPYQYGANNPIKFIDVNGDSIKVQGSIIPEGEKYAKSYIYNEGKFYDAGGAEYAGGDSFIDAVGKSLETLSSETEGAAVVNDVSASSKWITIKGGERDSYRPTNSGGVITLNMKENVSSMTTVGLDKTDLFVRVGHELSHAQDHIKNGEEFLKRYSKIWSGNAREVEKYATHKENQIRAEHNLPLRTHYGIEQTGSTMSGDEDTRILDSNLNRRKSIYYNHVYPKK